MLHEWVTLIYCIKERRKVRAATITVNSLCLHQLQLKLPLMEWSAQSQQILFYIHLMKLGAQHCLFRQMELKKRLHQLFYGVLMQGHRKQCHPKKGYKDCIKESAKHSSIPAKELEPCTQDRRVWHALTKTAFINVEHSR